MKLNFASVLHGVAVAAQVVGGCPLATVAATVEAMTKPRGEAPDPQETSPVAEALIAGLAAAKQTADKDPLTMVSQVMSVIDAAHSTTPAQSSVEPVDAERAKVLADRQRSAEILCRIQARIAAMRAKR